MVNWWVSTGVAQMVNMVKARYAEAPNVLAGGDHITDAVPSASKPATLHQLKDWAKVEEGHRFLSTSPTNQAAIALQLKRFHEKEHVLTFHQHHMPHDQPRQKYVSEGKLQEWVEREKMLNKKSTKPTPQAKTKAMKAENERAAQQPRADLMHLTFWVRLLGGCIAALTIIVIVSFVK